MIRCGAVQCLPMVFTSLSAQMPFLPRRLASFSRIFEVRSGRWRANDMITSYSAG